MRNQSNLFFFVIIFLNLNVLFSFSIQAQTECNIDSLIKEVSHVDSKHDKAALYLKISKCYYESSNKEALKYAQLSFDLSNAIKDSSIFIEACYQLAATYYFLSDNNTAIDYYLKCIKMSSNNDYKIMACKSLRGIGIIYAQEIDYNSSLKPVYNNAITYIDSACSCALEVHDTMEYAYGIYIKGSIYAEIGKCNDAVELLTEANKIFKYKNGYIETYLGLAYNGLGDYKEAVKHVSNAIVLFLQTNDINGQGEAYRVWGRIKLNEGQYALALKYFDEALKCYSDIKSIMDISRTHNFKYQVYLRTKIFKEALVEHELYSQYKDSFILHSRTQSIKLEFEKKEREYLFKQEKAEQDKKRIISEEKNKRQRIVIVFFAVGFCMLLVLVAFILRLFLQKKKINKILALQNVEIKQKNEEITAQKDEIEAQRNMVTEQRDHIEEIHKEVTDSINYAKRIQEAVLPISDIARSVLGEHFVLFKPKDIVSGDFYWTAITEEWLVIAVADCTGHGVPGAFMSMLGISILNEIVRKKENTKVNQVLNELRNEIIHSLQQKGQTGEQKDGMDIVLIAIHKTNNIMQYSGANNSLYIVSKSKDKGEKTKDESENKSELSNFQTFDFQLIEIKADKMPVAIHENMEDFTNHEIKLNKGVILYLKTDGFEDQFGGSSGKKFLSKNLKALLLKNCNLPMAEQGILLDKAIEDWKNGYDIKFEQTDDITVIGIKI